MDTRQELLKGRIIWVVGGGSGIGRAIALKAAGEGGKVYISGRRESLLAETVKAGTELGHMMYPYSCDALNPEQVDATAQSIINENGRIDSLVLSVGQAIAGDLINTSFQDWKYMQQSHLDTLFLCCKASMEGLKKSSGGNIVILGSIFGLRGKENRLAYCTVKGAIANFVRALALDLAGSVRVNSVCPGWVRTEMSLKLVNNTSDPESTLLERHRWHPMGRGGEPDEVADLAVFIMSGKAAWMTGQNIALDGGYTAR
ncbi:MAG: SDR family oxidoreductase [Nitrospirae bacterium]|nr:SDR family oxidoreductase [Nitrospirota bacterium]